MTVFLVVIMGVNLWFWPDPVPVFVAGAIAAVLLRDFIGWYMDNYYYKDFETWR